MGYTENLIDFIGKSTDCYHAVKTAKDRLDENGFTELFEGDKWDVQSGGKYYVIRNSSSIIAFEMPKKDFGAFMICASHTDSPSFKLKPDFEINTDGCIKLSVEGYGGMIMSSWLDRPLSISGRIVTAKNGKVETKLVNIDRDLLVIPSLAIHMSRDINKGYEFNIRRDMCPIASEKNGRIEDIIAENVGVDKEEILGFDLSLYNRMRGTVLGADGEYFSAPRIDDLQCMYSTLEGFLNSESDDNVTVFAAFDNEEVGSGTKQGAGSTFFPEVLKRISYLCGKNEEEYYMAVADSFMLSADNAHAVHPNYQDKTDPTNRPYINEGNVLKYNASQKYTTDANSAALVKYLCKKEKIKCQVFFNRSDMLGGSTLGNILTGQVSIKAADIGLPQLSMHSTYETAGCKDLDDMITLMGSFYELGKEVQI